MFLADNTKIALDFAYDREFVSASKENVKRIKGMPRTMVGYITNLKQDDIIVYDAKGSSWHSIWLNSDIFRDLNKSSEYDKIVKDIKELEENQGHKEGGLLIFTTDDLIDALKIAFPNKKAVYLKNVRENTNPESTNDLIVFEEHYDSLMRVTEEDYGKFFRRFI